jgi:hypothetical protein
MNLSTFETADGVAFSGIRFLLNGTGFWLRDDGAACMLRLPSYLEGAITVDLDWNLWTQSNQEALIHMNFDVESSVSLHAGRSGTCYFNPYIEAWYETKPRVKPTPVILPPEPQPAPEVPAAP